MKSRLIRVALAAALVLAGALPASLGAAETRGVVQRVDLATSTVYFTDGRTVRIDPGSRLSVDGRPVTLAEVQPGWTLVIPNAAATAPSTSVVVVPAPPPASSPRAPVDATGVVSRVDPQTGTIVLEDGRVLQATGRTTLWQSVPLRDVKPGASVFVRGADPLDYRPSASPPVGTARFDEGDRKQDADKKQRRTIGQIIDDASIVAEVTAKLTADKLSNFTKINVKSDAGTVTLSGTVDSAERRARAAQIAAGVNGVKTVLNNIEVSGGSTASTTAPPPASTAAPAAAPVEVTGTVASVDAGGGTITLQDGRVLKATDETVVWQPVSLGSLKPGSQVLVRGASASDYRTGAAAGARNWRMATISRIDRSAGQLTLSDGSTVKVTSATNVHRGADRLGVESLEPGSEVVVYTPSAATAEASEVAVVWMPTAAAR